MLLIVNLSCTDGRFDRHFLGAYANLDIKDELARVPGVGEVSLYGSGELALRVSLNTDRLAAFGITGPDIGRLQREGRLVAGERLVTVDQVSEPRRGQRFAFIMDTRLCDAAFELADGADMVVCESTFADTEAELAREYGHLTAGQAGRIAAESRARLLVLTHFSQRYEHGDGQQLAEQAATAFGGPVVMAHDLDRIPVPSRHPSAS